MKLPGSADIGIVVESGDVLTFEADVLALKYANGLNGVDRATVQAMSSSLPDIAERLRRSSAFVFTPTGGAIVPDSVLFVAVGFLSSFRYREIRSFARNVLTILADKAPHTAHIALTIHGPGYGLDEKEAFESEVAGLLDAINSGSFPADLKRVTIVERNAGRAKRLAALLEKLLPGSGGGSRAYATRPLDDIPDRIRSVGYDSQEKPHVFVAMPFAQDMDDVFHYGIQGAVNSAGFLCERADLSSFTGDVIDWVKKRIASASLVVADLSDANPNVYLEVGFAWGCGRPTVLIARDTSELKFDVRGQRCLRYKNIKSLESTLLTELEQLKQSLTGSLRERES
jgi:hypothetical protein